MSSNARASGMPSSSAGKEVGDIVQTPDAPIKSWRYLGGGKWEPNDAVRFTATGPGGGVTINAGGEAVTGMLLSGRHIAYIGDSRMRYGYEDWYYTAYIYSGNTGMRVDVQGCGIKTKLSAVHGYGKVEWDPEIKSVRWTAPGDTAGPWVLFSRAGEYKLQSGSPGCWLKAVWTSTVASGVASEFWVETTGLGRPSVKFDGLASHITSALYRHLDRPAYLGAGGAHTKDCFEMLEWYAERAGGPGIDVIRVGTNDINAEVRTVEESIAYAYAVFDARRAIGRKLVICGENARWARLGTSEVMSPENLAYMLALNEAYRNYALARPDSCRYADFFAVSADPDHGDGRPIAGMLKDNLHDSVYGASVFSKVVMQMMLELGALKDPAPSIRTTLSEDYGWMRGADGAKGADTTGTVPTGWIVKNLNAGLATVAASVVEFPGKSGRRLRLDIVGGSGAATISVEAVAVGGFPFAGSAVVGESLEVCADVEVVSEGLTSIEMMLYYFGSARRTSVFFPVVPGRYLHRSVPAEVISSDTGYRPQFYIIVPAGVTASVVIGDVRVLNSPTI